MKQQDTYYKKTKTKLVVSIKGFALLLKRCFFIFVCAISKGEESERKERKMKEKEMGHARNRKGKGREKVRRYKGKQMERIGTRTGKGKKGKAQEY